MQKMNDDVLATFSMPINEKGWLWSLLKRSTFVDNWNAATNGKLLASIYNSNNTTTADKATHLLCTNAFNFERKEINLLVNGMSQANESVNESQSNSSQNNIENQHVSPGVKYTKEYLESLKVIELKAICDKEHLKKGKLNKAELIELIMTICNQADDDRIFQENLKLIDDSSFCSKPLHHDHYRDSFNFVDKQNKSYYKAPYTYAVMNWRSKMVLCIMNNSFHNVFALLTELEKTKYAAFREKLSTTLFYLGNHPEKFSNVN